MLLKLNATQEYSRTWIYGFFPITFSVEKLQKDRNYIHSSNVNITAPYVMLLMRANPLREQVGGGWALKIETFCGPVT